MSYATVINTENQHQGSFAVGGAGVGVEANGVEAGMAEHVGDGDLWGSITGSGLGSQPGLGSSLSDLRTRSLSAQLRAGDSPA